MGCDDCREAISAGLDGEQRPGEDAAVAAHLDGCAECRRFADRAARVTRLARTGAAEPPPDLVAAVVAAAPRTPVPPLRRRVDAVRFALGAVGLAQLALAVAGLVGTAGHGGHGGVELVGASAAHLANESSAWNAAVGVGFLGAAFGAERAGGLLPVLTAFVGVLASLSVLDAVAGRVEPARLVTHGVVVIGLLLLLVLRRVRDGDGGAGRRAAPGGRRAADRSVRTLRRGSDDGGLAPTARRRAA